MHHRSPIRLLGYVVALGTILACGGSGSDVAGDHYPLTASVVIVATNRDADNAHFMINAEPFDISNRVVSGATRSRNSLDTWTWDNAGHVRTFNVFVGRGGVVLDNATVDISGDQRMQGYHITASWDGTDLTVGLAR
ncbi:MAG: hypothetical protein H3C58_12375 [Fimbriimonadaceae bacterium]|nr:hypothetical protein [Fimbriimonadaceae bacterium]